VDALGPAPCPRRAAASCVIDARWLVVYGGFDGATCLNDLFALDTLTRTWTHVLVHAGATNAQPGPRALHSICAIGHGVVVYGGASSGSVYSSTYLLHNAALSEGVRMQQDLQDLRQRHAQQECMLLRAQADTDVAAGDAARAVIEKQVCHLHGMRAHLGCVSQSRPSEAQLCIDTRSRRKEVRHEQASPHHLQMCAGC
jgi:hypothetical protein